jgi:hypothetical protein
VTNSDNLRMLVFRFNKNEKTNKKKGDDLGALLGMYQDKKFEEPSYDGFKQITATDESPRYQNELIP